MAEPLRSPVKHPRQPGPPRPGEAQRESDGWLWRVLVRGWDLVLLLDTRGRVRNVSDSVVRILGTPAADLIGRSLLELVHPHDRRAVSATLIEALADPAAPLTLEVRVAHRNGSWRTLSVSGGNLVAEPAVGGILFNCHDVTDRAEAEARVRRLSAAVEQGTESVVMTDPEGSIVYVNPAFERLSGYSAAEVIGRNPRILNVGQQTPEYYRAMWDRLSAGEPWSGEFVNGRKDGSHYTVEVVISPIKDAAGRVTHFVGVQRDVSHERELEAQLRQSQKLEAIGLFTAGIAHDLSNLLAVVMSNAELALRDCGTEHPDIAEPLHEIRVAADVGAGMMRQLVGFSRQAPLRVGPTDLQPAIAAAIKMLRRLLPGGITVQVQLEDQAVAIADAGAVEQILMNLVSNARDALPEGGTIHVELTHAELPAATAATNPSVGAGRYVCLSVADDGIGMEPSVRDRVFDPFFTTKPAGKGTGLGMAMVHGLTRQMHGVVEVWSEPGRGTRVDVYLPAVP